MKQLLRVSLVPLAIVCLVLGLITGRWLTFGTAAIGLLVFFFVYYSHRKQRIRYWFQGYKMQLEQNGNNERLAIESIHKEFCASKYADESVCNEKYNDMETLVTDIIKREFKFERLLRSSPGDNFLENVRDYAKAVAAVKKEIEDVQKES